MGKLLQMISVPEMEEQIKKRNMESAYKIAKIFFRISRNKSNAIGVAESNILYNHREIALREEFEVALRRLRDKKAPGTDNLNAELLKKSGSHIKERLCRLVQKCIQSLLILRNI